MNNKILEQNILDLIGLDTLSPEKRIKIMEDAGQVIFQAIVLRLAEELSEEDMNELSNLFVNSGDDGEKLMSFLKAKVPNLDEIVNEEIAIFKKEAVDLLA